MVYKQNVSPGSGSIGRNRKEELLQFFVNKTNQRLVDRLVNEIIILENKLEELEELPFIKVHPDNSEIQKTTPAGKLYTQLSAQYNSALRTLYSLSGKGDADAVESPLREWVKSRGK